MSAPSPHLSSSNGSIHSQGQSVKNLPPPPAPPLLTIPRGVSQNLQRGTLSTSHKGSMNNIPYQQMYETYYKSSTGSSAAINSQSQSSYPGNHYRTSSASSGSSTSTTTTTTTTNPNTTTTISQNAAKQQQIQRNQQQFLQRQQIQQKQQQNQNLQQNLQQQQNIQLHLQQQQQHRMQMQMQGSPSPQHQPNSLLVAPTHYQHSPLTTATIIGDPYLKQRQQMSNSGLIPPHPHGQQFQTQGRSNQSRPPVADSDCQSQRVINQVQTTLKKSLSQQQQNQQKASIAYQSLNPLKSSQTSQSTDTAGYFTSVKPCQNESHGQGQNYLQRPSSAGLTARIPAVSDQKSRPPPLTLPPQQMHSTIHPATTSVAGMISSSTAAHHALRPGASNTPLAARVPIPLPSMPSSALVVSGGNGGGVGGGGGSSQYHASNFCSAGTFPSSANSKGQSRSAFPSPHAASIPNCPYPRRRSSTRHNPYPTTSALRPSIPTIIRNTAVMIEKSFLVLGRISESFNEYEKAIRIYEHVIDLSPSNSEAMLQLGNLHRQSENYDLAISYLTRSLELDNSKVGEINSSLGHCYLMRDDLDNAFKCYQTAITALPPRADPKLWYGIGILYERWNAHDHAEVAFNTALVNAGLRPISSYTRGIPICIKKSRFDESLGRRNSPPDSPKTANPPSSSTTVPKSASSTSSPPVSFEVEGGESSVKKVLIPASRFSSAKNNNHSTPSGSAPSSATAFSSSSSTIMSLSALANSEFSQLASVAAASAMAYLTTKTYSSPFENLSEIYFRLGVIYKHFNRYDLSLICFSHILKSPPSPLTTPDVQFQMGHCYEQSNDLARAHEVYEYILKTTPNHTKALQQFAWLLHSSAPPGAAGAETPNDTRAVELLSRAANADPDDAHTHYLLGRIHMARERHTLAHSCYQSAVYLDPRNPSFWCSIGVLYYQLGQHLDALESYTRAIKINSNLAEVWYDLGTLYESCHNQLTDALDAYERASQLDPENPHILHRLHVVRKAIERGESSTVAVSPEANYPPTIDANVMPLGQNTNTDFDLMRRHKNGNRVSPPLQPRYQLGSSSSNTAKFPATTANSSERPSQNGSGIRSGNGVSKSNDVGGAPANTGIQTRNNVQPNYLAPNSLRYRDSAKPSPFGSGPISKGSPTRGSSGSGCNGNGSSPTFIENIVDSVNLFHHHHQRGRAPSDLAPGVGGRPSALEANGYSNDQNWHSGYNQNQNNREYRPSGQGLSQPSLPRPHGQSSNSLLSIDRLNDSLPQWSLTANINSSSSSSAAAAAAASSSSSSVNSPFDRNRIPYQPQSEERNGQFHSSYLTHAASYKSASPVPSGLQGTRVSAKPNSLAPPLTTPIQHIQQPRQKQNISPHGGTLMMAPANREKN